MASSSGNKKVSFSSDIHFAEERIDTTIVSDTEVSSEEEDESFCEITTSEGESYCTSDDEDETRLHLLIEGYAYSPVKIFAKDAVQRSSLLLLDKDLQDDDYDDDYKES